MSVGFGASSVTVREFNGMFMMCVRLNRMAAVDITVTLDSEDGSANKPGGNEIAHVCVSYISGIGDPNEHKKFSSC